MASLPETWEWDYDGKRWFYRFKPTGLIQYTFPKPGDEFPEYIDAFAPTHDLPPEDKLASQQQVKRKSTAGESSSATSASFASRRNEGAPTSATLGKEDGDAWFQPDSFMFLGPGSYNDISPVQEEEELARGANGCESRGSGSRSPQKSAAKPSRNQNQPERFQAISPPTSAETTPHANSSQPATATPVADSVPATRAPNPYLPGGLNGRQIQYTPVGLVAELASELTAQCREETHPAPVELPGNDLMHHTDRPVDYYSAFDIAPVELPAHRIQARPEDQKVLLPAELRQHYVKQTRPTQNSERDERQQMQQKPAVQTAPPDQPSHHHTPARQPSIPRSTKASASFGMAEMPAAVVERYQSYDPSRYPAGVHDDRRSSVVGGQLSVAQSQSQDLDLGGALENQPTRGLVLSRPQPTDVPSALQPSSAAGKGPVGYVDSNESSVINQESFSSRRRQPQPQPQTQTEILASLTPAHDRANSTNGPDPGHSTLSTMSPDVYDTSRGWATSIDSNVEPVSRPVQGRESKAMPAAGAALPHALSHKQAPLNDPRPGIPRTNTLPADMPVLPFMGTYHPPMPTTHMPRMPPAFQSLQPSPLHKKEGASFNYHDTNPAHGAQVMARASTGFSEPPQISSSDLPLPLTISRRPPLPGDQSNPVSHAPHIGPSASVEQYSSQGSWAVSQNPPPTSF
ncbi:hypothetical protein B0T22DRAFT_206790 [Podospora appendiculata]|uniref:Uncharacterized protein n=1 Tax=Podospora appendiculata TaxID=314037 RepID=A0AAE0X4A7_9PEZI|nr:hypothetical protein B0T22DRAFT_206790 [Podospora appendiculata]